MAHLNEHHQQLSGHVELLLQKHDLLRDQLNRRRIHSADKMPDFSHEFTAIDSWERNASAHMNEMINAEVERVRNVIRRIIEENHHRTSTNEAAISEEFDRLKNLLETLSKQLQTRMKTMDFLEPDLQQWETQLKDIARSSLAPQVHRQKIIDKLYVRQARRVDIDISNTLGIMFEDANETYVVSNNIHQENDPTHATKEHDSEVFNRRATRFHPNASSVQNASNGVYRGAGLIKSSSDQIMSSTSESESERLTSVRSSYEADRKSERKFYIS